MVALSVGHYSAFSINITRVDVYAVVHLGCSQRMAN
jgi:hypothetical protein